MSGPSINFESSKVSLFRNSCILFNFTSHRNSVEQDITTISRKYLWRPVQRRVPWGDWEMIFTSGNFHFSLVIWPSSVQNVQILSAWKLETQEATSFREVCTPRAGQFHDCGLWLNLNILTVFFSLFFSILPPSPLVPHIMSILSWLPAKIMPRIHF